MVIMNVQFWIFLCGFCVLGVNSFIVIPEELPSILSVFYSNVPPIKKGTDSRVGIGFRLGPNADFQVQFEIGPQTNTQPIGPNAGASNTSSKKRQTPYGVPPSSQKINYNATNPSEKWLNTWKFNLNEDPDQNLHESHQKSDPTREDSNFVNQLRKLYGSGSGSASSSSSASVSTSTSTDKTESDLSDVDMS